MGVYDRQVVPRIIDLLARGKPVEKARKAAAAGLSGDVLEVGFGSGRNLPYYPSAVRQVLAVDPATVGRALAAQRIAASPLRVTFVGLDGQSLPLESGSIDHVLMTWTLCTIPDPELALGEVHRVLRAGGALHFVEHGRSPEPEVAAKQDRYTPLQRRILGGCHLNREISDLIRKSGLELAEVKNYYAPGPKFLSYMYAGIATKAGSVNEAAPPGGKARASSARA